MKCLYLALVLTLSFANVLSQSNYYWIGDGGEWSDLSHWATTSGGSTTHTQLPSMDDNVFFDANSFTATDQTVALDVDADCKDIDWTGVTNEPFFQSLGNSNQNALRVYGSLTFSPNMSNRLSKIQLLSNAMGNTIITGEKSMGSTSSLSFEGSGEWTLMDSVATGWLRVKGTSTVNTNNNSIFTDFFFEGSSSGTINMGSSVLYTDLGLELKNSFTFNQGTSTIIIKLGDRFRGNNANFHDVLVKTGGEILVIGNNSFNKLEAEPGATINLTSSSAQIIENLELNGTKINPISFNSTTPDAQATVTKASGTVNTSFLILKDINAVGGATFNALNSVDEGNNTGWNITAYVPQDYYWVGGSGDWNDPSHWAKTSNGSETHGDTPGVSDAAIFDNNSGGDNTSVNLPEQGVTGDLIFNNLSSGFNVGGQELSVFGSLELTDNLNISAPLRLKSGQTETLKFGNPDRVSRVSLDGLGTWNLMDSLTTQRFEVYQGIFNSNNNSINAERLVVEPSSPSRRTDIVEFHGGTSDIYIGNFSTDQFWISQESITSEQVDFTNTKLYLTLLTSRTFSSSGIAFNYIKVGEGNTTFFGGTNGGLKTETLVIEPGANVKFAEEQEQIVSFSTLTASGTEDKPISLKSITTGSQAHIMSELGNNFTGEFLQIQDINASGATFTAEQSIDFGNNTGWTITSPKMSQTISFDEVGAKTFGDSEFDLIVSASSGLPVSLSTTSGNIELDGTTITIIGTGTATIKANQAGNDDFNPAAEVLIQFTINKASQTITFEEIADKNTEDTPFNLTAIASSGLSVTFSVVDGPITIEGGTVTITGAGEATIRALQAGDGNYEAAKFVDQSFIIEGMEQIVGLLNDIQNSPLKVYPNPSTEGFTVELDEALSEIFLIDSRGIIKQLNIIPGKNLIGQGLVPGIYLLKIRKDNDIENVKLVKLKR